MCLLGTLAAVLSKAGRRMGGGREAGRQGRCEKRSGCLTFPWRESAGFPERPDVAVGVSGPTQKACRRSWWRAQLPTWYVGLFSK